MRKHIIITKLFEFGGSNSHLKTLINYFGKDNVILILESNEQLIHLNNIINGELFEIKILPKLHGYAHLSYLFITNVKELFFILRSIISILLLSIKHGFADVTISAVEPEKHLYLLWLPFIKVTYILHSTPARKLTWFTTWTCCFSLGKEKKIITVSNANKKLLCDNWDIPDKKKTFIYVIYNCIIESRSKDSRTGIKSTDQKYIVTLGHVTEYKNPVVWLEVAKQVTSLRKNVHFIWLGNGPLWDNFEKTTQETKRITFQGSVTNPQSYLLNATIYYQPSLLETHGIAVIEAMSYHLPSVVSDVGGLPESIQHKYNGFLVQPTNISEQVNALLMLLDNTELRQKYGLNAYNKYQELFSYNSFKAKMNAIYI